jgi:DNA-binding XRE family transcriptional regulator
LGGGLGGDAMTKNRYWYYRSAAYMTQSDLAKSLGVCEKTVSRWEAGTSKPNGQQERKLAQHCAAFHLAYTCPCCEVSR